MRDRTAWGRNGRKARANPPPRGIRCLDERGRRTIVTVALDGDRVLLRQPDGGTRLVLTQPQVGRLRAALREAIVDYDFGDRHRPGSA